MGHKGPDQGHIGVISGSLTVKRIKNHPFIDISPYFWTKNFGSTLKKSSGRSSRTSKYTKTFEEPEEETVIAPAIDYDTDIEEAQEKEINEYDTAATGIINYDS